MIAPFARYPKGTTNLRVLPLARALAARGHEVTVLVPPYDHPAEAGRIYVDNGVQVESLPVDAGVSEESIRQTIAQPKLAKELVDRALSLSPDVVHVFKPKAVSGLAQLFLIARRAIGRGSAIVLDTDDWEGDGGWNEYERYPWWQKRVCDWQERWGLEHADAITAASRTLEAQAWSHRVPPERVSYLPNGLDPQNYPGWPGIVKAAARRELGLGPEPLLVLYTRFFEFAPRRMSDVLQLVRAQETNARLLVVGAGKHGQEWELERLARARGLADALQLVGWQDAARLPLFLEAGDVLLFPMDDNLANRAKCSVKLLEALWLGKAVVADRVGQQAEYVQDGVTGLLSEPAAPESMAGQAVRLIQDDSLADRLGAAARDAIEARFNWGALAPRAERAYAAALRVR